MTNLHEYDTASSAFHRDAGVYDIAIVGGGLAGLALSIQCAKAGYRVVVFEKEQYPSHKVCGEYISFEAWDFLERLGVPLVEMNLPVIRKLIVSAPNGKLLEQTLPLGGFGISRYKLDSLFADIARKNGVELLENIKVESVNFENGIFNTRYGITTVQSQIAAASFGKRSNLDIKWKRRFTVQKNNRLNNYIGVKYHVQTDYPAGQIALHNFKYGYCGISQVEDGKYCLCYMTSAKNLRENGNSIPEMEKKILQKNPHLKNIFSSSIFLTEPVTISQISFDKKTQVENHILFVGDAAGMITPLCGNGMSMALHASKLAFEQIHNFLQKKISREQMENAYQRQWRLHFHKRLSTGRTLQRFFGSTVLSNLLVSSLKPFPGVVRRLIRATHGQSF